MQRKVLVCSFVLASAAAVDTTVARASCAAPVQTADLELVSVTVDGQAQSDRSAYNSVRVRVAAMGGPIGARDVIFVGDTGDDRLSYWEMFHANDARDR
jgi:hypothetical protein